MQLPAPVRLQKKVGLRTFLPQRILLNVGGYSMEADRERCHCNTCLGRDVAESLSKGQYLWHFADKLALTAAETPFWPPPFVAPSRGQGPDSGKDRGNP